MNFFKTRKIFQEKVSVLSDLKIEAKISKLLLYIKKYLKM